MTLRLFAGGIGTETNPFSSIPTGLDDFAPRGSDSEKVRDRALRRSGFAPWIDFASAHGHSYIQGSYSWAQPAGLTSRSAYEMLRNALLAELRDALPLDGVLLNLHGAMVADGYLDCETDLVGEVRAIAGARAKIGVLFDPHCDITQTLIDTADVLITYKEYPHTDIDERASELIALIVDAAEGKIDPVMALYDCRMLGIYPTTRQPMKAFVERMRASERDSKVLSVSLAHSFPWGDAPEMGARTLVVSDGDIDHARRHAGQLGREFFALRDEVSLKPLPMSEALDLALSRPIESGPVVVADVSDNAGGGAASDSTFVLSELLTRGAQDVAIAVLWDPIAVHLAFAAGVGASLDIRLGGKIGPSSGDPLDLEVTVRGLVRELQQHRPQEQGYFEISSGDCAWLNAEGIDVVVGTTRQQVFGLEVFTALGIDPSDRRVLVVKSANHFRAAFAPIASEIIYMSPPGALTYDFSSIPYLHLEKNKYPLVDDPWAT